MLAVAEGAPKDCIQWIETLPGGYPTLRAIPVNLIPARRLGMKPHTAQANLPLSSPEMPCYIERPPRAKGPHGSSRPRALIR